jgi:hypothetical protein
MKHFNSLWIGSLAAVIFVLGLNPEAKSHGVFRSVPTPGIHFSADATHRLSPAQQQKLLASLRRITGWAYLKADERGHITFTPTAEVKGGSAWARRILNAVTHSGRRFVVENHFGSPTVNFGQLDEGLKYADDHSGVKLDIYRVRLDFADFQEMQAGPEVRAAFDEGFTLLHELLHGLGLEDTTNPDELGDCERLVNQIRTDLGVPLRDQYLGDLLRVTPHFVTLRLRFKSLAAAGKRVKKHYLFFSLAAVPEPKPRLRPSFPTSDSKEKLLAALAE